jgi:DNA-binding protein WhiA
VDNVRQLKSVKNAVNRRVNAEVANERRSSRSGADQTHVVRRVDEELGFQTLPPALREFCELRLKNPELSLADLGRLCDPPASKSAMYHRVLRLQQLLDS